MGSSDEGSPEDLPFLTDEPEANSLTARSRRQIAAFPKWDHHEEESLIHSVRKFPALWDKGCNEYRQAGKKSPIWQSIADDLGTGKTGENCYYKWGLLMDQFRQNLRNQLRPGWDPDKIPSWWGYEALLFMKDQVQFRKQWASPSDAGRRVKTESSELRPPRPTGGAVSFLQIPQALPGRRKRARSSYEEMPPAEVYMPEYIPKVEENVSSTTSEQDFGNLVVMRILSLPQTVRDAAKNNILYAMNKFENDYLDSIRATEC